jgi:hypothetical protein
VPVRRRGGSCWCLQEDKGILEDKKSASGLLAKSKREHESPPPGSIAISSLAPS